MIFAYLGVSMEAQTVVLSSILGARCARECYRERRQQDFRLFGGQYGGAKLLYCRQFERSEAPAWGSEARSCCTVVNLLGSKTWRERRQPDFRLCWGQCGGAKLLYCRHCRQF